MRKLSLISFLFILMLTTSAYAQILHVVYDGEQETDAWLGFEQGVSEANIQGKFLGIQYKTWLLKESSIFPIEPSTIIISTGPQERILLLASKYPLTPIFSVVADVDGDTRSCLPNVLYTLPSNAILNKATAYWQTEKPSSLGVAYAWHYTFKKYAASQLNKRFQKYSGIPMTDASWSAWAAVKLFSDVASRSSIPSSLLLMPNETNSLAFDGQKGVDLYFNPDLELLQPLLIVENGKIVGEFSIDKLNKLRGTDSQCQAPLNSTSIQVNLNK